MSLTRLPQELRDEIYRYLFSSPVRLNRYWRSGGLRQPNSSLIDLSILSVSREIHRDAYNFLTHFVEFVFQDLYAFRRFCSFHVQIGSTYLADLCNITVRLTLEDWCWLTKMQLNNDLAWNRMASLHFHKSRHSPELLQRFRDDLSELSPSNMTIEVHDVLSQTYERSDVCRAIQRSTEDFCKMLCPDMDKGKVSIRYRNKHHDVFHLSMADAQLKPYIPSGERKPCYTGCPFFHHLSDLGEDN